MRHPRTLPVVILLVAALGGCQASPVSPVIQPAPSTVAPTTDLGVLRTKDEAPPAGPKAKPSPSSSPSATPTAAPKKKGSSGGSSGGGSSGGGSSSGPAPTPAPTATPTAAPTAAPTVAPTVAPTATPTASPTATPTAAPTATPTAAPTASPTPAPPATPTPAPTPTPATGLDSERQAIADRVLALCNIERAAAGVPPLVASSPLDLVATFRSEDMATRDYFSHTDPDGNSPFWHIKQAGISYRSAGENIAYGYRTPEAVVEGWMTSEGHRKNILSTSFGKLGVGYALNSDGTPYWTQLFTD